MITSQSLSWDDESRANYDDDWDVVTHLSAASCSVEASSQVADGRLRLRGGLHDVRSSNTSKRKEKWSTNTRLVASLTIAAIMVVSTVTIQTESRSTLASASTLQHKKVLTSEMFTKSYHKSGFATTVDAIGENGLSKTLEHLADVSRDKVGSRDVPFFLHIPRSGGGSVKYILGGCYGLTEAADAGGRKRESLRPASLEILHADDGTAYVNVDTSTTEGIKSARSMGLVESGLANVIVSQHLHPAATLFNKDQKGRCFTMIRHPIQRAVSMFHYLAVANWEPTYDPSLAYISIEMYARSKRAEHNWLVRFLSGELEGDLNDDHLAMAKEVLREKCLIGLLHRKEESFLRFEKYFGWVPVSKFQTDCRNRVLHSGWSNKHSHPEVEVGSVVWELLMKENYYDIKLYHFVLALFDEQARLFESETNLPVGELRKNGTVSIEAVKLRPG
ncbi:hypothetical protein MHU86_21775 [Fragilaria crotonensis]|nr:hypothetical protein MHU86_21775 [Fragilaria crotonensis]